MICRLLGVPEGDDAVFTKWAEALSPVFFVITGDQIATPPRRSSKCRVTSIS